MPRRNNRSERQAERAAGARGSSGKFAAWSVLPAGEGLPRETAFPREGVSCRLRASEDHRFASIASIATDAAPSPYTRAGEMQRQVAEVFTQVNRIVHAHARELQLSAH